MGKTTRERILVTLLPAFLALCGYLQFFNRDADLKAAQEALASARSARMTEDDVFVERMALSDRQDEAAKLKAEKGKLESRKAELASLRETAPAVRAEALRQLSKMLWNRGLHLYQESPVTSSDNQIAPSFDEVIRGLTPPGPPPSLLNPEPIAAVRSTNSDHLWQVRFYGRYADVAAALESLRDSGLPIIPVSITMSEARHETAWRSWTLLLWL